MKTKRTRYNVVGSGILHLLMHSAVAGVSVWGRGMGGTEPLAVSCEHMQNPVSYLKTATLTAFRVIFFALWDKFEI